MTFKENILTKIRIKALSQKVLASIGPLDSGLKVDREAMRRLLEIGCYDRREVRDLELYILDDDGAQKKILVLDNDLSIYYTTIEDVAMRKSPVVKEMVNIRNAIKILKDSDVILCKKQKSVELIRDGCLDKLDLACQPSDLKLIADEGKTALQIGDTDDVVESLAIFAELLGYEAPPKRLQIADHKMFCRTDKDASGVTVYGPFVFYSITYNKLCLLDSVFDLQSRQTETIRRIVIGTEAPSQEGSAVFDFLLEHVQL